MQERTQGQLLSSLKSSLLTGILSGYLSRMRAASAWRFSAIQYDRRSESNFKRSLVVTVN